MHLINVHEKEKIQLFSAAEGPVAVGQANKCSQWGVELETFQAANAWTVNVFCSLIFIISCI